MTGMDLGSLQLELRRLRLQLLVERAACRRLEARSDDHGELCARQAECARLEARITELQDRAGRAYAKRVGGSL